MICRLQYWLAGFACLIVLASLPARAEPRIALVITNQAYTQAGALLTNTHRDGDLIKAALEKIGFNVWVVRDTVDERALLQAIAEHVRRLAEAGPDAVGFFYYSGHGAADRPNGENFLIPTNVPLRHASQLPLMAVQLNKVTSTLSAAGRMSFVVFDACRNVPLQRETKDLTFKGFAPVREQTGLLVAFATEPGNVAVDQSFYARALSEEMLKPGLEAGQVFRRVRLRVREETNRAQSPEYLDKRDDDFHFAHAQVPATCDGIESQVRDESRCLKPGAGRAEWFKDCPTCPEMVVVPAGRFVMGSPKDELDREPIYKGSEDQRAVTIGKPFAVGRFAVTRAEFAAFAATTGHEQAVDTGCYAYTGSEWKHHDARDWRQPGFAQNDRHPVVCVDWKQATAYAEWLKTTTGRGYRLLSEAEREYVARAGTTTPFWWGSTISSTQANFGRHASSTMFVDSFEANLWGLYNVHGNVSEWTADCWNERNAGNPGDGGARGSGDCGLRVLRGGSWDDNQRTLRAAARGRDRLGNRGNAVGFRVARSLN